jgi:hypothetical protein
MEIIIFGRAYGDIVQSFVPTLYPGGVRVDFESGMYLSTVVHGLQETTSW